MKKILAIIFICILILTGCAKKDEVNITIVTTNFPSYDFARAITKNVNGIKVKMVVNPGVDTHDFEPTPKDIIDIKESDLFIYVGGDSDEWVSDILNDMEKENTKIVKLLDLVEVIPEENVEGMEEELIEEEEDLDEHVWTSPVNAIEIVEKLKNKIIEIDNNNSNLYEKNASDYIEKIKDIDNKIVDIVSNSKRKVLVFADRFPILYFVKQYSLDYYAAFKGCAHETEASAKTISFLISKIKEEKIPVVFHIELSNSKIADTIKNETGVKILEFNAAHNISKEDFDKGITYVDIMNKNIISLKEALN